MLKDGESFAKEKKTFRASERGHQFKRKKKEKRKKSHVLII